MRFIGITGGVGAGKSAILLYLKAKEGFRVMLADEIAHELMMPGQDCYEKIIKRFSGMDLLSEDKTFDRIKLAQIIFSNEDNLRAMNEIVHPAVKDYVIQEYEREKKAGRLHYLILEAALLIEEEYDKVCDELWYIYTSEEVRRARLKESRGYSDEKIDSIFKAQLSEEEYRSHCKEVIDNNGDLTITYKEIEKALGRSLHE